MFAEFGYGILVLSLGVSLYSVWAAIQGHFGKSAALVESARRALVLTWPLLTVASLALIYLLTTNQYNVTFVYEVTSRSMPLYLKVTALWGGQSGSLVFWSWLMAAFGSIAALRRWDRDREFLPWVVVVTSITIAFFLFMVVAFENPFARFWATLNGEVISAMFAPQGAIPFTPTDGRGLNPLLRHPGMIIHPPLLYLGFVAYVVPFAFAIAALVTGRTDDRWIRLTRRWALVAWLFLSFGLVLGGRWAYDVLGWGGYWGWDPVEIAAFMPWLTGTAFLHSVMIQEKRGMLKQWNMVLIILTYALVIFGTFLTRSGVLSSVHSFAQSAIGPFFFGFIGLTFITSMVLLFWRWSDLRAEAEMKSLLSREALFLLNNLLFMAILVVCFWGVISPLMWELFTGSKITLGPPFYERANAPLFAMLMLLMALAPLSAWGLQSSQNKSQANSKVDLGIQIGLGVSITAVFGLSWDLFLGLLNNTATVVTLWACSLIIVLGIYYFRHLVWKPALAAGILTIATATFYTQNIIALIGFFLVALVILVTLIEFWRAARARQKAHGENFFAALARLTGRNRRRYGGYIIHISMMLMAIGILGIEIFQVETQGALRVNESLNLGGYTVTYREVASFDTAGGRNVTRTVVSVYRGDEYLGDLAPRIDYYYESQQPMTIPGVRSTLQDDLYVLLVNWEPVAFDGATFKVYLNPLVNWLWIGSLVFLIGVIVAAWPEREADPAVTAARVSK